MSELESNLFHHTNFIYELEQELNNHIECEVSLGKPIELIKDTRLIEMHSNERRYSEFLLRKGVIIFPEPELIGFEQKPDFFVWKPNTQMWQTPYSGFFYEITLCSRADLESGSKYCSKKYARKRRQKEMFESLGLPMMYIYKEDQERIERMQTWIDLF
jgi:hypothetical protein